MNEMEQDSVSPAPKRTKLEDNEIEEQATSSSTKPLEQSKYDNYVNPEELERLKEFKVLDEVKSNDEDSNDEDSESSEGEKSEGLPDEEIERMLDEDLPEGFKGAPKPKERPFVTRQKVVLEDKGVNHFEVLPLDWMMVRHYSGMPVYMHRTSRVCTLSKPYFLGKGNTRRHEIPISAIPCYAYRRALEEETKQKEIDAKIEEQIKNARASGILTNPPENKEDKTKQLHNSETKRANEEKVSCPYRKDVPVKGENYDGGPKVDDTKIDGKNGPSDVDNVDKNVDDKTEGDDKDKDKGKAEKVEVDVPRNRQPVILPGGIVMPPPRVETVNTSWKTQHLTHEQVNNYCKKLFQFKTVHIMHFERWADRRKYNKARKTLQYPTLPEGTKLITIPATPNGTDSGGKSNKRDWVMNMNGRSYLSVFHEYVRRALQKQPVYEFVQLENASTPYQATVYIGGMQYGVGHGSSKRQAKSAAARASIQILIPEMKDELDSIAPPAAAAASTEPDFSFFDCVTIEDPRITEFCAATCEPSPHAILRTCLLRNFGAGDRHIQTEMKKLEFQKIELTMKVGKHSATVVCKNKKTAKQRASQAILQALHPHVRSWGSLLRLYGSRSVKSCKEKKLEEQQITLLQDKAQHNEPNYAVLAKLKHEMTKLREQDASVVPIGTLMLQEDLPSHSGANLNNVDL